MVSFAHVRTQAHDIVVYSLAGTARHECLRKQKRPDIKIMELLHDPDVRPFGDSLGLFRPRTRCSVRRLRLCYKLLASLYRKALPRRDMR